MLSYSPDSLCTMHNSLIQANVNPVDNIYSQLPSTLLQNRRFNLLHNRKGHLVHTKRQLDGRKASEYTKISNFRAKWKPMGNPVKVCGTNGQVESQSTFTLVLSYGSGGEVSVAGDWVAEEFISVNCPKSDTSIVFLKCTDPKWDRAESEIACGSGSDNERSSLVVVSPDLTARVDLVMNVMVIETVLLEERDPRVFVCSDGGDLTSHLPQCLFDVGTGRISIVTVNTVKYHSDCPMRFIDDLFLALDSIVRFGFSNRRLELTATFSIPTNSECQGFDPHPLQGRRSFLPLVEPEAASLPLVGVGLSTSQPPPVEDGIGTHNPWKTFAQEDVWEILKTHSKWDAPEPVFPVEPVDLTEGEQAPEKGHKELFGEDPRPRPPTKPVPPKECKFETTTNTGGSNSSNPFKYMMSTEYLLKREAAAYEVAKEKDPTVMRLE
ncbi:hypothetical protein Tco_0461914 [Tanacetum coccineum]